MTRAVLFDLDGTLTPRRKSVERFAELFADDFAAALAPCDRAALARTLVVVDQGGYNRRRAEDLIEALEWRDAPAPAALAEHWQRRFPDAVVPQPGLHAVLDALRERGLRTGLVTNGVSGPQGRKVERLGIRTRLDTLVVSEAVGCEKPDPRIFEIACGRLGVAPADCWFVGDHPEKDVLGAQRFGMRGVWLSDPESPGFAWPAGAEAPAHRIARLDELPGLVS